MYAVVTVSSCYIRFRFKIEMSDIFAQSGESGPDSFQGKEYARDFLAAFRHHHAETGSM